VLLLDMEDLVLELDQVPTSYIGVLFWCPKVSRIEGFHFRAHAEWLIHCRRSAKIKLMLDGKEEFGGGG